MFFTWLLLSIVAIFASGCGGITVPIKGDRVEYRSSSYKKSVSGQSRYPQFWNSWDDVPRIHTTRTQERVVVENGDVVYHRRWQTPSGLLGSRPVRCNYCGKRFSHVPTDHYCEGTERIGEARCNHCGEIFQGDPTNHYCGERVNHHREDTSDGNVNINIIR